MTSTEILVQLPGVDDPARVKQIMQTAALLEIYRSERRPVHQRRKKRWPSTAAFCR